MRAWQEPEEMRVEREIKGLSGSGTNLNETVGRSYLEAGVRASLRLEWQQM